MTLDTGTHADEKCLCTEKKSAHAPPLGKSFCTPIESWCAPPESILPAPMISLEANVGAKALDILLYETQCEMAFAATWSG